MVGARGYKEWLVAGLLGSSDQSLMYCRNWFVPIDMSQSGLLDVGSSIDCMASIGFGPINGFRVSVSGLWFHRYDLDDHILFQWGSELPEECLLSHFTDHLVWYQTILVPNHRVKQ